MKISLHDYLKGQRKAGTSAYAEKYLSTVAAAAKEPTEEEVKNGAVVKTFVLSPTGGEIHRGESVVDRITKPETLKQKIARFERLAQKVRQSRESLYLAMQDSIPDGDDPADDFEFEDGDFVDDFGDVIEPIKPVKEAIGEDDGEQPAAPQSQAGDQPSDEPVADPDPQE